MNAYQEPISAKRPAGADLSFEADAEHLDLAGPYSRDAMPVAAEHMRAGLRIGWDIWSELLPASAGTCSCSGADECAGRV